MRQTINPHDLPKGTIIHSKYDWNDTMRKINSLTWYQKIRLGINPFKKYIS